jgi:hypothetical protein
MALLSCSGEKFTVDGRLIYSEVPTANEAALGLLMNARFIQGVFDDKANPSRFDRFGRTWNADQNTDDLIAALPRWYSYGLRAITVGLQGGMPVFTIENSTIDNNPFSDDGRTIDEAYLARLDRLIRGADRVGMGVIVSILYEGQSPRMHDGRTIRNAVATAAKFLKSQAYQNVIIEVANEHNVGQFRQHPIVYYSEGIASLIDLARRESGGMLTGASGGYGHPLSMLHGVQRDSIAEVAEASDVILIHGNALTRQGYYNLIRFVRELGLDRPIVCNEDSQCHSRLDVAYQTETSWGYYNNLTKQEPPADWGVTPGEDLFFARRMARGIGIPLQELSADQQLYFQGFEPHLHENGKRWLRVAAEFPERVDRVHFYRNGTHVFTAFDEPFLLNYKTTWIQDSVAVDTEHDQWRAEVVMTDGRTLSLHSKEASV